MDVYIYCQWMSPTWILQEIHFQWSKKLPLSFLLYAPFHLLSQGWPSTERRHFVSLIHYKNGSVQFVTWHCWDLERDNGVCTQSRKGQSCRFFLQRTHPLQKMLVSSWLLAALVRSSGSGLQGSRDRVWAQCKLSLCVLDDWALQSAE